MNKYIFGLLLSILMIQIGTAQGPPITSDNPIMLSEGTVIVKTLTEVRVTDGGDFTRIPIMVHYLPTSNTLVAIHIPYIDTPHGNGLGDIEFLIKYQFLRKDFLRKTFRMVLKSKQTLPTGLYIGDPDFGIDKYQAYYSVIAGYETIKHGMSAEVGYRYISGPISDRMIGKIGFGLPLLKPLYPVNQLNLYFENTFEYALGESQMNYRFAQGIQYARKQWTYDLAVEIPVMQRIQELHDHKYSIYLGTRYIF